MARVITNPQPIRLKRVLKVAQISKSNFNKKFCSDTGLSIGDSSMRYLLDSGYKPVRIPNFKRIMEDFVRDNYTPALAALKMQPADIWEPLTEQALQIEEDEYTKKLRIYTEVVMLKLETMKHFGLKGNPFTLDVRRESEIFMGSSHIFALEVMRETAQTGGFAVITGEVGAGKSTVRRKFFEESRANKSYQIIYPESIDKSKLTAKDILHAIIYDLTEAQPKGNKEALSRQAKQLLLARSNNNERTVLVIEEAHDLPVTTLKFLKRIWELENGLQRLLGVILIGQNELETRLYGRNSTEIREVTARTAHAKVCALDKEVSAYIKHRLNAVKADINKMITPEALAALTERMQITDRMGKTQSMAYPLFVNNVMMRLMNYAADAGEEIITPEIVVAAGV